MVGMVNKSRQTLRQYVMYMVNAMLQLGVHKVSSILCVYFSSPLLSPFSSSRSNAG